MASPVIVPCPSGGWDLFVVALDHTVRHGGALTPAGLFNPSFGENLGGFPVFELSAAYDRTGQFLVLLAHGGPPDPAHPAADRLKVRIRDGNGWGDWIRIDTIDVA